MNLEQLIERTNSFEEFRIAGNYTTDEALVVLIDKLKELKDKRTKNF